MKIVKLKLENFRGYTDTEISFDKNFNLIIGKNDIGKSTILEALDIFFEGGTIKLDVNDCNVYASNKEISITVSFSPEDREYTVDTVPTRLDKEYLLDKDGFLTVKKVWDCSKSSLGKSSLSSYILANYPSEFEIPLISMKIADLKKKLEGYSEKLDIKEIKKNKSSEIRQAIYNTYDCFELKELLIPIDKEDGKKIKESIEQDYPLFFLFQADRANKDSDKEVQDPLKAITKSAISDVEDDLKKIQEQIKEKAVELGNCTLEKLKEMNPEIANILSPQMVTKNWDSLFSFSFNCDDGIPINKRGSGVRRLILLNYFRAEAERKNARKRNVIYGIEEPETSQHPDWQIKLLKSLLELSKYNDVQVLTTTHSPSLASLCEPNKILFLKKNGANTIVEVGNDSNFKEIAETLGVLPDVELKNISNVKLAICLEGPNDVSFIKNINEHIGELSDIVNIKDNSSIIMMPLGGGTLKAWVNNDYIGKLRLNQFHLYDSDIGSKEPHKYAETVEIVNAKGEGNYAVETTMREMENIFSPSLVKELFNVSIEDSEKWDEVDVPEIIAKHNQNSSDSPTNWESLKVEDKKRKISRVKRKLNNECSCRITKKHIEEIGHYDEVKGWFEKIKELSN